MFVSATAGARWRLSTRIPDFGSDMRQLGVVQEFQHSGGNDMSNLGGKSEDGGEPSASHLGIWIGIGVALGVALGAAFHQIGAGVAIGVGIGVAIGTALGARKSK